MRAGSEMLTCRGHWSSTVQQAGVLLGITVTIPTVIPVIPFKFYARNLLRVSFGAVEDHFELLLYYYLVVNPPELVARGIVVERISRAAVAASPQLEEQLER